MRLADAIKCRIIEICEKDNITLNKACTQAGINHSTVASFFAGKTAMLRTDTIYYLCIGFKMTLAEFYSSPLFDNIDDD